MPTKFTAKAHHAYSKSKPDELDLAPGDVIHVSNDEHATWWVGTNKTTGQSGWFPSNFVDKLASAESQAVPRTTPPPPRSRPKKPKRLARVVEQFDGTEDDDLSLAVGDVVEIIKETDGWCLGRCNGKAGMFPADFVEDVDGSELQRSEPPAPDSPARRPLPVPPVPGSGPPLPLAPPLPRRSTTQVDSQFPPVPPTVPTHANTPPLPPRTSTEISRTEKRAPSAQSHPSMDQHKEVEEEVKKEKHKTGKRISRLFSSKKSKSKDHHQSFIQQPSQPPVLSPIHKTHSAEFASQPDSDDLSLTQDEPAVQYPSERSPAQSSVSEDKMGSPLPPTPSRPLPQVLAASSSGSGRPAIPTLVHRSTAPLPAPSTPNPPPTLPPIPSGPASIPGLPQVPAPRRPSVSSIGSSSSAPDAQLPLPPPPPHALPQSVPDTVEEENEEEGEAAADTALDARPKEAIEAPTKGDSASELNAGDDTASFDNKDNDDEGIASAPKSRGMAKLAKVVNDYEAKSNEELNLMSGDVVTIIHRGTFDDPRWKGEYHGKKGYFPADTVKPIEESADLDEEEDESAEGAKPKGFKLAAYGVQQGGLGSIFAGGGIPALRKTAPRRPSADESTNSEAAAPAPAHAPAIPKLRSIRRPAPKEEPKEEPPNFLAHLNRVPRKKEQPVPEETVSPSPHVPAPLPAALARRATNESLTEKEPSDEHALSKDEVSEDDQPGQEIVSHTEPENVPIAEQIDEVHVGFDQVPETVASSTEVAQDTSSDYAEDAPIEDAPAATKEDPLPAHEPGAGVGSDDIADTAAPSYDAENEPASGLLDKDNKHPADQDTELSDAEHEPHVETEQIAEDAQTEEAAKPALDPVKAPSLPHVKRLVRRGQRQKPSAEGLKRQSEDSQYRSLQNALSKDKDVPFEQEPEPEQHKAMPPPPPEKPKGLARHGPFSKPQLPVGGFKASGRVGSAMASRLAALQARASGNMAADDDDEYTPSRKSPSASAAPPNTAPLREPAVSPPPSSAISAQKPKSFTSAQRTPSLESPGPSGSAEWQKQIENEQSKLRRDIEKAQVASGRAEELSARLDESERERKMQRQAINEMQAHVESLTAQLSMLKSEITGIRSSVDAVANNKDGVSSEQVSALLHSELHAALEPIRNQNAELRDENKKLSEEIKGLRAYVDELVVEEEE